MSEFQLIEMLPRPAAVVRAAMAAKDLPPFFGRALEAVAAAAAGQGLELAGEPFAFYPGAPTEVVEVAAGFPVSGVVEPTGEVVPMELPGGRAVTTVHVGPYDTMHKTYAKLHTWLATQRLTPAGHMWEVYLSDPSAEPDPSTWRTQIFWPLEA